MMNRSPYAPPESELSVGHQDEANKRYPAVILAGAAIGEGLSYLILTVFGLVLLQVLVSQGVPVKDLYTRAYSTNWYVLFAHFVGFCCMTFAGVWVSRLSPSKKYSNAAISGAILMLFALLQNFYPFDLPIPFWSRVLSFALPIPAYLLGVWLHCRGDN